MHAPIDQLIVAEVEPTSTPGLEALRFLLKQITLDIVRGAVRIRIAIPIHAHVSILHDLLQLLIVAAERVQILTDILEELVKVVAQIEALMVVGHARLIIVQQLSKRIYDDQ